MRATRRARSQISMASYSGSLLSTCARLDDDICVAARPDDTHSANAVADHQVAAIVVAEMLAVLLSQLKALFQGRKQAFVNLGGAVAVLQLGDPAAQPGNPALGHGKRKS